MEKEETVEILSPKSTEEKDNKIVEEQRPELISPRSPAPVINAGQMFWRDSLRSSRYILAPMVDQSELAFRLLVRRYGVECTYSPMFHAACFVRDPKYRRDCLQVLPELDRPLIIQFCANKPEIFVQAATMAAPFCEAIDLNLGCPQTIAKRGHYGAFLQDDWELIHDMIQQASRSANKPITCKIRVFEDIDRTIKYAKMIESAGAMLIGVHGRYREQKGPVTGLASWPHIKAVKDSLRIPVFANGNIQCLGDVERCFEQVKVEGVMSAEGILHNPSLFTGKPITVWDATREYLEIARQHTPPFSYMRGHVFKLLHHCLTLDEHSALRRVVAKTHKIESLLEVANKLEDYYRVLYEQFLLDNPKQSDDQPHPDSLPIFFCKPYYRPPPTEFNSKIAPKSESNAKIGDKRRKELFAEKSASQSPTATSSDATGDMPISKRQKKKMERLLNKKLKIGDIEEECVPVRVPVKRQLDFCSQSNCPNPKGARCEFDFCKKCCRIKTQEEVLDCAGHRKARQMNAKKNETIIESIAIKSV